MSQLGVALVGAGRHGLRYARHIVDDLDDLKLVGLWRRDQAESSRLAAELGCQSFADYRELIASPGVDLVLVVVPPALHPEILDVAASCGRAVLLEKPAAVDLPSAARMLATVERTGIPVMVAQTLRYNGVVKALRQAIDEIGPVHALRISQRFEPSRPGWVDDPDLSGGGVLMLTGIHSFDMARHLTGLEVSHCLCEIGHAGTTVQTEDNFSAILSMGEGRVIAAVSGSRATLSRSGPVEITGERGLLFGDHALNFAWMVKGTSMTAIEVGPPVPTVRDTLAAFAAAVRGGQPMPVPLIDGLRAVAVVRSCYEAAAAGRRLPVAEVAAR